MRELNEKRLNDKSSYPSSFGIDKRQWDDWTYQAATSTRNGTRLIYSRSRGADGIVAEQVEYYSGPNYVTGATGRSYSRCYKMDEVPATHKTTAFLLELYLLQQLKHDVLQEKVA